VYVINRRGPRARGTPLTLRHRRTGISSWADPRGSHVDLILAGFRWHPTACPRNPDTRVCLSKGQTDIAQQLMPCRKQDGSCKPRFCLQPGSWQLPGRFCLMAKQQAPAKRVRIAQANNGICPTGSASQKATWHLPSRFCLIQTA
jgi:hypothetical protein